MQWMPTELFGPLPELREYTSAGLGACSGVSLSARRLAVAVALRQRFPVHCSLLPLSLATVLPLVCPPLEGP